MIKIDFHMHTVCTASDAHFEFELESMKRYVEAHELNAIAITNHNIFDMNQYIEIRDALSIKVFPGIEINLGSGHLLLISDDANLDEFNTRCSQVEQQISSPKIYMSVETLLTIFPDLHKYILIPHYDKKPALSDADIQKLHPHITAGEVQSPKKFIYCIKDSSNLVPVYFSDTRMAKNRNNFPARQTFLSCEDTTFAAIKNCLNDHSKVSLSEGESHELFDIFDNGQKLSTGLNVILGGRSSGKSHTLNAISGEFENATYIKQFSLVERNEEEDGKRFDKLLSDKHSLLSSAYLKELKDVIADVINLDLESDLKDVENYIESLKKYARESERRDSYSKAALFSEDEYDIQDQTGLKDLIKSTKNLASNTEFRDIIDKYISVDNLRNLYVELMKKYTVEQELIEKKRWVNENVKDIKTLLKRKTAATTPTDVDLYKVIRNINKAYRYAKVVELSRRKRVIESRQLQGFEIVATSVPFDGAGDIKKAVKSTAAFMDAFKCYNKPYDFLQQLKLINGLAEADYHKCFVKIEYKILNRDKFELSGGERSEFNLLQLIQDATKSDILLIDEPESSFDNIFLREEVNQIIKSISENIPVVLVTHNNTVGASIKPDYILYTKKEHENGTVKYQVYSGNPTDKELVALDGKTINTYEVTIGCLEAGTEAYEQRKGVYENLKN